MRDALQPIIHSLNVCLRMHCSIYTFLLFACNHIDHGGDGDSGARDGGDGS